MGASENNVVNEILYYLNLSKIFAWRNNTQGTYNAKRGAYFFNGLAGVADILGVLPDGKFLAIECKAPKKKPKKDNPLDNQVIFKNNVLKNKGKYILADCVSDVIEGLK